MTEKTGVEINAIFQAAQAGEIVARQIWNEAIEEAARSAINAIGYQDKSPLANHVASEIRKLKK